MRLRITKQLSGVLDGVDLSSFRKGSTYDIGATFASYLLALDAAVPILSDDERAPISSSHSTARTPKSRADARTRKGTRKRR